MKKLLIALCGALTLAAFAEPAAPAPEARPGTPPPAADRAARPNRGPRQKPMMINISERTKPEEVAAFKAEVLKKIDDTVASFANQPAGERKRPVRLVLFSNEGMGPRGEGRGRGPRGEGRGPGGEGRGPRPPRGEDKPAPAPEAK